jgi:hypothetical protein
MQEVSDVSEDGGAGEEEVDPDEAKPDLPTEEEEALMISKVCAFIFVCPSFPTLI